jgi:large subunit ribosomal protein L36e
MRSKSGIFAGKGAGYTVTKPAVNPKTLRPSYKKGRLGERTKLVRSIVRELAGFTPAQAKAIRFLTTGTEQSLKRAGKFLKKRIGTHRRAKVMRDTLVKVVAVQKKAAKEQAAKEAKVAKDARDLKERAEKIAANAAAKK